MELTRDNLRAWVDANPDKVGPVRMDVFNAGEDILGWMVLAGETPINVTVTMTPKTRRAFLEKMALWGTGVWPPYLAKEWPAHVQKINGRNWKAAKRKTNK